MAHIELILSFKNNHQSYVGGVNFMEHIVMENNFLYIYVYTQIINYDRLKTNYCKGY
jgi:hypothetical protein